MREKSSYAGLNHHLLYFGNINYYEKVMVTIPA
jgi:hypothetical protein